MHPTLMHEIARTARRTCFARPSGRGWPIRPAADTGKTRRRWLRRRERPAFKPAFGR